MREPPDYDRIETIFWREWAKDVLDRLKRRDASLIKRIYTYIARFGYPMDAVVNKIKTDEMFAAHFTKEPRRTSLHGNLALEWLKETDVIREIEKLPSSGEVVVYITSDGEIRAGMLNAPSKSPDFRWRSGRHTIYPSNKFTKKAATRIANSKR